VQALVSFNQTEADPGKAIELLVRDFSGDPVTRDAIHARLHGQQFAMHGHGAIWGLCELAPETKQLSACNQIVLYRTIQYDLITSRFRGKIIALWVCLCWRWRLVVYLGLRKFM